MAGCVRNSPDENDQHLIIFFEIAVDNVVEFLRDVVCQFSSANSYRIVVVVVVVYDMKAITVHVAMTVIQR